MIESLYKKIAPVGRVPIPLAIEKSQVSLARRYEKKNPDNLSTVGTRR